MPPVIGQARVTYDTATVSVQKIIGSLAETGMKASLVRGKAPRSGRGHSRARNETRFGVRYCPNHLPSGDDEKDLPIIRPWVCHRDEIERDGHCRCRVYYKKEKDTPGIGVQE